MSIPLVTTSLLFFIFFTSVTTAKTHSLMQSIPPSSLGFHQPQKLSHLHFFFHDDLGSRNPTAVRVAAAPTTNKSSTMFGAVVVMDDLLTELPNADSTLVGRAQGIYASASTTELEFLLAMNLAFTQGKYNGSSLTVLGRNPVKSAVREMPVVGGSGLFRFARGYAQAKTHSMSTSGVVVEYDVYVLHY
ncbi:dirigent protein 22-like [Vigna radiata var. radiata]|uniref:Dirigent protein n=1 Tax=Vigna radiata var. radiata TaxID=3916 RepID=A0A1S3UZ87_VIGRR|nr:dirigent protein 22-like [Vigna radiata var. radiata]